MTDDEILSAYRALARYEGIFCEPASAASVAGVTKAAAAGELDPAATVVCVLTGHGLKDPGTAERQVPALPGGCADHRLGRRGARLVGERTMDARWLAELDGSRITVEVPATSANLGAGYDCLGLALAMTNTIELEIRVWSRGEIDLTVDGEGEGELTADHDNHFVRGLETTLRAARGDLNEGVGWRIVMHNRIPLARGLGSSASATVGGVLAGNALAGEVLTTPELLRIATDIEGHPDNAAAALLGGFVVSAAGPEGVEAIRFDAPRDLRAMLFIPDRRLSTEEMRAALPEHVPLADAVANLGAVAVGVAGLATGRYDLLGRLTADRIHEPYRAKVFPELPRMVEAAREAGALGRLPVRRRLDDHGVHGLDGGHHPDRERLLRGRRRPRPARPRARRRAAQHRRPGRQAGLTGPLRCRGLGRDEGQDLAPGRVARVGELGRLAVEEAVRRALIGDEPVVDAGGGQGVPEPATASGGIPPSAPPNRPRTAPSISPATSTGIGVPLPRSRTGEP